jgi:hypothetical protein
MVSDTGALGAVFSNIVPGNPNRNRDRDRNRNNMTFEHEKLDVYCLSTGYAEWIYEIELDRIAAMLSRLGGRGYCVQEHPEPYGNAAFDPDFDSDFDTD